MHFNQLQETVEGAKTAVDAILESVQATVNDTEGVQPTADLLDYVQQNSWLLMGSAPLMGYILSSPAREDTSTRQSSALSFQACAGGNTQCPRRTAGAMYGKGSR